MADDSSWTPKQDMSLLCRVCANQHDYLIPIFEGEGLDHDMPTKMDKHLPITVRENDKLPTQMCYQCASTIIAWSELVTNCLEADKKLSRMLKINEKKAGTVALVDEDATSDHYEDAYDDVGGGDDYDDAAADDEDFEKEIKQLISDAGVELGSKTTKAKTTRATTRKRKSETVIVKKESKKSKTDTSVGKSSISLIKPKEEVTASDDRRCVLWTCCTCNAMFNCSADLTQHMVTIHQCQTQSSAEQKRCPMCYLSLDSHTRVSRPSCEYICFYCGQAHFDKLFIELHIKIDHGQVLYQKSQLVWYACKICCKLYTQSKFIRRHMRHVHSLHTSTNTGEEYQIGSLQDISFLCKDCSKPCLFSNTCPDHSIDNFSPNEDCQCDSHTCQFCPGNFSNCSKLWTHMFGMHGKEKRFLCNLCLVSSKRKQIKFPSDIVFHMRQVHGKLLSLEKISMTKVQRNKTRIYIEGVLKHRCSLCNEIFDFAQDIRRHFAEVHKNIKDTNAEKTYLCKLCGKEFSLKKHLLSHYRDIHNKLSNFECDDCGRAFNYKSQLTRHMISHTRERASVCELCGAAFSQPAGLYNHKFTHDNTRYACTMCEKSYTHPSLLKVHMKSHTDTTKYMCEVCGKDFNSVRNLKRHKLTHNTLKSFVCSICNTGFTVKKYLIQHYKTHRKQ